MYLKLVKKSFYLLLFWVTMIQNNLTGQSSAFPFQYWDSLYMASIEQHPDSADAVMQKLISWTEEMDDNHGESYAKYVLANEFFRIGAWGKAIEYNQQALDMCQDLQGEAVDEICNKIIGRSLFLAAKLHHAKGNLNQAIFHYERVLELSQSEIDKPSLLCYTGLGEIYLTQGEYLKAYQYFELARHLVIDNKMGNQMSAMVLLESAELMNAIGLDSLSEVNLKSAEQISFEYADTLLTINILSVQGANYLKTGQFIRAEDAYTLALKLAKQKDALNLMAASQLGLGKIFFKKNNTAAAKIRLEEAARLSTILVEKNNYAESQVFLGKIELEDGELDAAFDYCNEAYDASVEASLLRIQSMSCNCLKKIYERKNIWHSAFLMQEEEQELKEKLNENVLLHKINSVRFDQALTNLKEEQARELNRMKEEKKWKDQLVALQSSRIVLLSVLFGINLLMAFVLYSLFKAKKSHNTKLQSLNQRLKNGNQLLENSNNDLNASNEALQQTNQALNNFAAVAAHDLKAPLRTINSFTQLLKRRLGDKVDENEEEYFQYISSSSKKLATLIDDLLNFSRLGKQMTDLEAVELNQTIKDVEANLQQAITENQATISYQSLPEVMANPSLMIQVFQNIISNGIKFAKKDQLPAINITSKILIENRVQFSIQDNGIGIAKEHQEQIFELFTRLNSKKAYEGSGVGLATCRKIIQHYGGKMSVESTEGVGTTFFFDLPMV